jgi:hypothetical protein
MIVATMVDASTADEAAWPAYDAKRARGAAPAPVAIAVFGDLILPGPRYDARFVHASSFGEPGALEGIRLMILAPTSHLNHRQRETVTALSVGESSAAGMPILQPLIFHAEQHRVTAVESERVMRWRWVLQERCIEAALPADQEGTEGFACPGGV